MQTQRINFTLPNDLARSFRQIVPTRFRSKFIVEAIETKLGKQNVNRLLRKSGQAQKEIILQIAEDFKYTDNEIFNKLP